MTEQLVLVALIDFSKQLNDEDRLNVNDLMNHLEDRVRKFDHSFRDKLDDHVQAAEEALGEIKVILLHQVHQWRYEHGHEWHAVRLVSNQVPDAV